MTSISGPVRFNQAVYKVLFTQTESFRRLKNLRKMFAASVPNSDNSLILAGDRRELPYDVPLSAIIVATAALKCLPSLFSQLFES